MPNPPNTSKTAISDEGFTDWLIGEEKVPHEGGKDEDLHVVGEHEVPQEMGEYEGLWQEGAFDKAVADDTFISIAQTCILSFYISNAAVLEIALCTFNIS